jgi:hypothetical protein
MQRQGRDELVAILASLLAKLRRLDTAFPRGAAAGERCERAGTATVNL